MPRGARPPLTLAPPSFRLPGWFLPPVEATDLACLRPLPPDVDSGYYTVKFDSLLLKEAVVEGDRILPPLRTDPPGSSDSDSGDADDPSYARGTAAVREARKVGHGEAVAAAAREASGWRAP